MTDKPFKSKIPTKYWEQIFEWYTCGMNKESILVKMQIDHQLNFNNRTLGRLLAHLKEEKQDITSSFIAKNMQEQVAYNLTELQNIYKEIKALSQTAYKSDNNLYFKSIDRLTKLIQIQLGIENKEEKSSTISDEDIVQGLIKKLGDK
jgi:hypothetical protein